MWIKKLFEKDKSYSGAVGLSSALVIIVVIAATIPALSASDIETSDAIRKSVSLDGKAQALAEGVINEKGLSSGSFGEEIYAADAADIVSLGFEISDEESQEKGEANDDLINSESITPPEATEPENNAPVASDDSYSVDQGNRLTVASPGVLSNDNDVDGDSLSAILISDVSNGVLSLESDGSFLYRPNIGFSGSDSFTYKADDGLIESEAATVSITIIPSGSSNQNPVAFFELVDIYLDVSSGSAGIFISFDASGSTDSDGSIVSYEWDFGDGNTGSGEYVEHTYTSTGVFEVILTVTDDDSASDTTSMTITFSNGGENPCPPACEMMYVCFGTDCFFVNQYGLGDAVGEGTGGESKEGSGTKSNYNSANEGSGTKSNYNSANIG